MSELKGKVAMITGGGQGIGRSFTENLLQQGVRVMITDLQTAAGDRTAKELAKTFGEANVMYMPLDVLNAKQYEDCIKATIQKMGSLDILLNNAGICDERDVGWERMVAINFNAVVRGTKLGMKYMGKNNGGKGGWIINTASITSLVPFETIPVYASSKAAVSHVSRGYGQSLYYKKTGVKVIAINPGLTDTKILTNIEDLSCEDPDVKSAFAVVMKTYPVQKIDNMGKGLIQVLKKAESGTVWTIENDEPAKLCTNPA